MPRLPAAAAESGGHVLEQRDRLGPQLLGQPEPPLLENPQRPDPIPGHGPGLHLGPHGILAQVVQRKQVVGHDFDPPGVARPAVMVHEPERGISDGRQPAGPLLLAPQHEIGSTQHFQSVEKPAHLQRWSVLVAQHSAPGEAVEIELEVREDEAHLVATGLECAGAQLAAQHRESGRHRVPGFRRAGVRPEEIG